eukprot:1500818-Rhodomonas_salina.1
MHATPVQSLLAPPLLMHADAHDALGTHDAPDVTPLPPLLAPPSAAMRATALPSLLAPAPSMHANAHDTLNAND